MRLDGELLVKFIYVVPNPVGEPAVQTYLHNVLDTLFSRICRVPPKCQVSKFSHVSRAVCLRYLNFVIKRQLSDSERQIIGGFQLPWKLKSLIYIE